MFIIRYMKANSRNEVHFILPLGVQRALLILKKGEKFSRTDYNSKYIESKYFCASNSTICNVICGR